MIHLKIET